MASAELYRYVAEPGIARMKNWRVELALTAVLSAGLSAGRVSAQTVSPADAQALQSQGKLAEATQAWRSIVGQHPNDSRAYASLGVVLSRQQKYQEAASAYRRALQLNPKLPGLQLNLGLAEFKQGQFRAAVMPFRAALASDPKNSQALTLVGLSYYGSQQFAEASKYLKMAAATDAANTELRRVLAQSCLWAKDYSCALDEFSQILQTDPDSAGAHILSGEALDGLGRTPEAIEEFQVAAKISPREQRNAHHVSPSRRCAQKVRSHRALWHSVHRNQVVPALASH